MAWWPDYWSTTVSTPELPEPSDSALPVQPAAASSPAQAPRESKSAWLRPSVLIAAIALVLLGWQWMETRQRLAGVQEELARRLSESDAVVKESRVAARQAQESLAALQAKVGMLEAQLAETQGQQSALDAVYQELSKSGDERLLAEIEQSVTIAAQQLRLAGNVEAAMIALTGAEARLARTARPQFLGLRKLVARDIERLKAQPSADVPGVAMKLEGIIAVVDTMPLAYERRPKVESAKPAGSPVEASFWRGLASDLWNEVRHLVRVERIDSAGAGPALLSPTQSFFLRENLKLRLVNARLALLSRDGRSFREDLRAATTWLERYFDASAKPVQASLATLNGLQAVDVGADAPGLSETLDAIRNFKLARERK
jgi:uroporphyrin-III C-methyltransferase